MKTLLLLALLFGHASYAQNLNAYDRAFPKVKYSAWDGILGAGEVYWVMWSLEKGRSFTGEFWRRQLPAEHAVLDQAEAEVERLINTPHGTSGYHPLAKEIKEAQAQVIKIEKQIDQLKLVALEKKGIDLSVTAKELKKVMVFEYIRHGVLIYVFVDGASRMISAWMDRDPGFAPAATFLHVSANELVDLLKR